MFGADVVVIEVLALFDGVSDDFPGPRSQLARRYRVGTSLHDHLDLLAYLVQIDVKGFQGVSSNAPAFLDKPQKDVLGANVFVIQALGLLIGQLHHLASATRKAFVHGSHSLTFSLPTIPPDALAPTPLVH